MTPNRTILHVDDDPSMLRFVATKLANYDYDVVSLNEPALVSDKLLETGARVVLLDVNMGPESGLKLLQAIKNHDGGTQVIMLTGLVSMSTVLHTMRLGAEACIFKPITDVEQLLESIEAAFRKVDRWWQTLSELSDRQLTGAVEA